MIFRCSQIETSMNILPREHFQEFVHFPSSIPQYLLSQELFDMPILRDINTRSIVRHVILICWNENDFILLYIRWHMVTNAIFAMHKSP